MKIINNNPNYHYEISMNINHVILMASQYNYVFINYHYYFSMIINNLITYHKTLYFVLIIMLVI